MKLLRLKNKQTGDNVFVVPELVWYWYHSPAENCTRIVSNAGAYFPVEESTGEVEKLYKQATKEGKKK